MKISVIGSSSKGNTIICKSGNNVFVLDAGVNIKEVMVALNYDISNVKFVAVTHKDSDHAKYIREYLDLGITVYMPSQVKENYKGNYNAKALKPLMIERYEHFKIIPFEVPHGEDVTCYSYVISGNFGKLLYMVDASYCPYNLSGHGINYALVECNHSDYLVDRNAPNYVHSMAHHMSDTTCCKFLETILGDLRAVFLCHMSDTNANAQDMLKRAREIVDCPVYIAESGLTAELDEVPFL